MNALIGLVLLAGIWPDTQDVVARSSILQAAEWESSGVYSDYGAPTPTWECRATASGGDFNCSGVAMMKSGTGTTDASPLYPAGFSGTNAKYTGFNDGSNPRWWYAPASDPSAGANTAVVVGYFPASGTTRLFSRYASTWEMHILGLSTALALFYGPLPAAAGKSVSVTPDVGYFVLCTSWDGSGNPVLVVNNLSAGAPSSGGSRPIANPEIIIGSAASAYSLQQWTGSIHRIAWYAGWAATETQCQNIISTWQGKRSRIPHAAVAFTRAGAQTVAVNGSNYTIAANVPGISEKGVQMDSAVRLSSSVTASTGNRLWCLQWKGSLSAWENTQYLMSLGTAAANNSARLYIDGDKLYFATDGPAGEDKSVYHTHGFAAGSEHTIKACHRGNGLAPYFVIDGVRQAGTVEGTGIGPATLPTTLYIGASNSSGTSPMTGWIKRVAVCRTEKGCGM